MRQPPRATRKDNKAVGFRLPNDLLAALDAEAARTGLSRNVVAQGWLAAGMEIERERLASLFFWEAMASAKTPFQSKGSPWAEVKDQSAWAIAEDASIITDNEKADAIGGDAPATTER